MRPILSASLINCHAVELDSIVFKETQPMVRMFVARPNHNLWKNHPRKDTLFSLGLHMHRQDITMVPLFGSIYNLFFSNDLNNTHNLAAYTFSSKIAEGKGGFAFAGQKYDAGLHLEHLAAPTHLPGHKFHSVYVPYGESAAWLICEGVPTRDYSSICYSNDTRLAETDFSELYQPMTEERLQEDLDLIERHV